MFRTVKLKRAVNSRIPSIHHFIVCCLLLTSTISAITIISLYIFRGFLNSSSYPISNHTLSSYNNFIERNGKYVSITSYKIVQYIKTPISDEFNKFTTLLRTHDHMKQYFRSIPTDSYYITLADLKQGAKLEKDDLEILKAEQEFLDKNNTTTICFNKDISLVHTYDIRMDIELPENYLNALNKHQQRWNTSFPQLITEQYTSYYITLASQLKDIRNTKIFMELVGTLQTWETMTYNLELGPIMICLYTNLITCKPIRSQ